eukprot:TRINITY_DN30013_c0_g1_i1.p1 TRINITY_DN30013_c0_g1~~TRINITY_DN30013_c0_g1_i1.p1  ORF type:complete len:160 (+),score=23.50 TRINITY_DN30013_c0_g1_i1:98-577(+)
MYVAKRAIVTGSPRVLRNINFHHMPTEWKVLQQQNIGVSIKCFARYAQPWWRTDPEVQKRFDSKRFSGTLVSDHVITEVVDGQERASDKQIAVNWVNDNSGKDCGPNPEGVYNGKEYVRIHYTTLPPLVALALAPSDVTSPYSHILLSPCPAVVYIFFQ